MTQATTPTIGCLKLTFGNFRLQSEFVRLKTSSRKLANSHAGHNCLDGLPQCQA